jgi:hypothetical protein
MQKNIFIDAQKHLQRGWKKKKLKLKSSTQEVDQRCANSFQIFFEFGIHPTETQ